MALSVSHPVSTRDTNIMILVEGWYGCDTERAISYYVYHIYLNMRKSCSVLWTFSHMINIILRGLIKGWWYRYQSRQTNTDVMFFQYHICKFPLFSTKYMININKPDTIIYYCMVFQTRCEEKRQLYHTQIWKCSMIKTVNSLYNSSFSSCLDQVWHILFPNISLKKDEICWSEEFFLSLHKTI